MEAFTVLMDSENAIYKLDIRLKTPKLHPLVLNAPAPWILKIVSLIEANSQPRFINDNVSTEINIT